MKITIAGLVLYLICVPRVSYADAFTINLLSASHSITVSTEIQDYQDGIYVQSSDSRTTTESAPVSDALLYPSPRFADGLGAAATADLFDTSTSSSSFYLENGDLDVLMFADAYATSVLSFTPVASGLTALGIDFFQGASSPHWSEAWVALRDITAAVDLWSYGWAFNSTAFSTVPWRDGDLPEYAPVTDFDASHVYELTLFSHTNANMDSQAIATHVSGLQVKPVPEPSALALLALGVVMPVARRVTRRFRQVP